MWAVFRPQQEHGSHQLWVRMQGDGGEWARRLGSSPFFLSVSLIPPMMLFRKHTMVDTCVLSERTLLLFMCSAEGRKKARGAVKQAKAMLPHSPSLSFSYFSLSSLLPPIFNLSFIVCVQIQTKDESCMKPYFCFYFCFLFVISSVLSYFLEHQSNPTLRRPQKRFKCIIITKMNLNLCHLKGL